GGHPAGLRDLRRDRRRQHVPRGGRHPRAALAPDRGVGAHDPGGDCRITTLSGAGLPSVEDVSEGDLWFFPAGLPHSLQGLGPDGAEFVLAFDDGEQSESNTLLLTDWIAHTPPEVLAKNFGVSQEVFRDVPLHNLWIFPGE